MRLLIDLILKFLHCTSLLINFPRKHLFSWESFLKLLVKLFLRRLGINNSLICLREPEIQILSLLYQGQDSLLILFHGQGMFELELFYLVSVIGRNYRVLVPFCFTLVNHNRRRVDKVFLYNNNSRLLGSALGFCLLKFLCDFGDQTVLLINFFHELFVLFNNLIEALLKFIDLTILRLFHFLKNLLGRCHSLRNALNRTIWILSTSSSWSTSRFRLEIRLGEGGTWKHRGFVYQI